MVIVEARNGIDSGENSIHGTSVFWVIEPPAERTQGDRTGRNRRKRTCCDLGLAAHVEQFGVFEPFHLCGMCAIGFILWIFLALRGRGDKEVNVFDQDFHRLIAQVHPMKGECEFAEVTYCRNGVYT